MPGDLDKVQTYFIAPLALHFSPPESAEADLPRYWRHFTLELAGFDQDTLSEAGRRLVRRWTKRVFPPIPECLNECRAVAGEKLAKAKHDRPRHGITAGVERAERLICCDLGRRAAREGWIVRLFDFALKAGRLPDVHEISDLIDAHARTEADWAALVGDGKPSPVVGIARRAIEGKFRRLCDLVEAETAGSHRSPYTGENVGSYLDT